MTAIEKWMHGYTRAWESCPPGDVEALFAPEAEYWRRPDDEPIRGRAAIVEWWRAEAQTEAPHEFRWSVVAQQPGVGVIEGRADYEGDTDDYLNLWVVNFDDEGRATRFVEWWMVPTRPADG